MTSRVPPVRSLTAGQVRSVIEAATAAPSLHNAQPWRFHCTPDAIELHADPGRAAPATDPDHRELLLSCGAALVNLRLAIRALGVYPEVRCFPVTEQTDLLAVVRPQGKREPTPADQELAAAIQQRHTNRRPFLPVPVPTPLHHRLRHAAEAERAWLAVVSPAQFPMLRGMLRRAHETQRRDPAVLAEWQSWIERDESTPDRLWAGPAAAVLPREPDDGQTENRLPGKDFQPSPLIAVIGSFHDNPLARLQAGQAMQRVLLTATTAGLTTSFLSQVVQVPQTRTELRTLIGGGLWPQTLLRIGYGTPVSATPRRPVEEVLSNPYPELGESGPGGAGLADVAVEGQSA
jgi:hypothetical protein